MRFGTWNMRSLHRSESLMTVVREFATYKLDLLGVQEVILFSMEKGMKTINWELNFLYTRK
jgi:hypothetical protein